MKTKLSMIGMAAALLLAAPASWATLLIQDTFNTTDTGLNDDLASRQSGTLAGTTWNLNTSGGTATISGHALAVNAVSGSGATALISLNHSFTDAAIIAGGGFSVSFDMKQVQSNSLLSFGLGLTDAGRKEDVHYCYAHSRDSTDWGFSYYQDGSQTFVAVNGTSVQTFTPLTVNEFFNVRVDVTTADFDEGTTATVDFYINDSLIDGDREFTWDADGTNYLALSAFRGNNPDMVIDNFSVSAIPEPATSGMLLLGAVAGLGLLRRKLYG